MRITPLFLCVLLAGALRLHGSDLADGEPRPLGLTKFDRKVIDAHQQLPGLPSCIPSAAEMVLKLLGQAPASYYDLQRTWRHKLDGSFRDFHNKTFLGVTFRYTPGPTEMMIEIIDRELRAGRFVVIGLRNPAGWHSWVVYDKDTNGEFLAVSKNGSQTIEERQVKKAIAQSGGTDVGIYEFPTSPVRLPSSPPRFGQPSSFSH
jgi:hypothetical protein